MAKNKGLNKKLLCKSCKENNHASGDGYFKGKPQCWVCKRFAQIGKTFRSKRVTMKTIGEEKNEETIL